MADLLPVILSFSIGIGCSLMFCCIGMYPGLFAYLNSEGEKPSRLRAGLMSVAFSLGVVAVVAAFGLGFMLLGIELASLTGNGTLAILHNIPGFALLTVIGMTYLTGRSFRIPVPTIGAPNALIRLRGFRAAPIWGMFTGGPGATHCTVALVIPIVFLSLSARDPTAIAYNFSFYAIGRVIPITVMGLMMHDMQMRFLNLLNQHAKSINRIIGVTMLASGLSLFFVG